MFLVRKHKGISSPYSIKFYYRIMNGKVLRLIAKTLSFGKKSEGGRVVAN